VNFHLESGMQSVYEVIPGTEAVVIR